VGSSAAVESRCSLSCTFGGGGSTRGEAAAAAAAASTFPITSIDVRPFAGVFPGVAAIAADALRLVACASPREPVPRSMLAAAQHAAAAESTAAARALLGVRDPDLVLLAAVAVDFGVWTKLMTSLLLLLLPLLGSTCALAVLFISAWGRHSRASSGARSSFGILTVCLGLGSASVGAPLPFRFLSPSTSWVRGLRQRASSPASNPEDMRLTLLSMIVAIAFCDRLNRDSAAWIHTGTLCCAADEASIRVFKTTNCREGGGFLYGGFGPSFGCGCTTAGSPVAPLLRLARSELPLLIAVAV